MPGHRNTWTIEEHGSGFDVKRNGRAIGYDYDDVEEAKKKVYRHSKYVIGDTVVLIELDGHRQTLV